MAGIHLAVDIGASSGRHIAGWLENGRLSVREVYRFDTRQVRRGGHDCWDLEMLAREVEAGMKAAADAGLAPDTLAIDTWGVDFVTLDAEGYPTGDAVAYRDARTDGAERFVLPHFSREELYRRTGIQFQKFNTIYQLAVTAHETPEALRRAETLLMIPEYLAFRLTGKRVNEYTNASTTGLLDAKKRDWDFEIIRALGFPERIFGKLREPGTVVGGLTPEVSERTGCRCTVLTAPSHDTASAYLAAPIGAGPSAVISSGTWSLIGTELTEPSLDEESRRANFTNEGGAGGTYRFLKNIMGLWIIQSIRRELNGEEYVSSGVRSAAPAKKVSFAELEAAARESRYDCIFDVDDDSLLAPASMTEAVTALLRASGAPTPESTGDLVRSVYLSLADRYARSLEELGRITGKKPERLYIVGGGSRDGFLNELTARAAGIPVYAGPSEATSIGNLLMQLIAAGEVGDIPSAREIVKKSFEIKEYVV